MWEMSPGSTGAGPPVDRVPEAVPGEEPLDLEVRAEGTRGHASQAVPPAAGPLDAVSGEGVQHVPTPSGDLVAEMTDGPSASEQDRLWLERDAPPDVDPDK